MKTKSLERTERTKEESLESASQGCPPSRTGPAPQDLNEDSEKRIERVLLSRRELAERWRCCTHTIARRQDLRPIYLGKRLVRYRIADVQKIEAGAVAE